MEMLDKAIEITNQHFAKEHGDSDFASIGGGGSMGFTKGFSNIPNATIALNQSQKSEN
jgi:hypothetical protein